ncbi:hypothetical protein RAB80_009492 [Fusarium oxysporum f. sp. vasinfectum]|nr:hypothetical protein RAB80_009492 [Fusarium oxysporum f. sp. vasinfectum]KAK2930941.1 hypothetical protein FoTM2_008451 [Fusarium oxysporum f. sp. vasinfectum]
MTLLSPRVKTAALLLFLRTLQDVPQIAAADAVLFFAADAVDAPVADRPHPDAGAGAGAGETIPVRVPVPVPVPVPVLVLVVAPAPHCIPVRAGARAHVHAPHRSLGRVDDRVQAPVAAPVPYAVREDCLSIRRQPVSVLLFPERNIRVAEAPRPPAWIRQANSLLERVDNA